MLNKMKEDMKRSHFEESRIGFLVNYLFITGLILKAIINLYE